MTRSRVLVRVGLGNGLRLLPWIAMLVIWATLADAMNVALAGGPSARDQQPGIPLSTSDATCAASGRALMHVGLDPWIVATSRGITCESGAP